MLRLGDQTYRMVRITEGNIVIDLDRQDAL